MEIKKCVNAISSYKAQSYDPSAKDVVKTKSTVKNTDKVEFSSVRHNAVSQTKTAIAQNVDSSTTAERISALRNLIGNGQYNISSETIASSIIDI